MGSKKIFCWLLFFVLFQSCGKKNEIRREYFENGRLHYEYGWENGMHNGLLKEYNEAGTVIYEGSFKDDLKTGWHIIYYPGGGINQRFFYQIDDGKERWVRKQKYDAAGRIISDVRAAKKRLEISGDGGTHYSVGDTLVLRVKILEPKYEFTEGVIGFFDEDLNVLKVPKGSPKYISGNAEHEVVFHILLSKRGPLDVTGFMRDFEYHSYTDSTGWSKGEDTFFRFPVVVE